MNLQLKRLLFQIGYFSYQQKESIEAKVTIYSYKNAQEYIKALQERENTFWAYHSRVNYRENAQGLSEVASFSTPIEGSQNLSFIQFPEAILLGTILQK